MTPTLRNVATRSTFFHNGVIHDLTEAVEFYAQRDTDPSRWYPRARDGTILKFDDLPEPYRANGRDRSSVRRAPRSAPALTAPEIEDVVRVPQNVDRRVPAVSGY